MAGSMIEIERYRSSPTEVQVALDLVEAYHEAKLADIAAEKARSEPRWSTDHFEHEARIRWQDVEDAYERWLLIR